MKGFIQMINEVHDIAGQHEVIAENLTTNIVREIYHLVQDLKQERKKVGLQSGFQVVSISCMYCKSLSSKQP